MYTIEIRSNYAELYRYNIIATCAGYDAHGEQLYVDGVEKIYSEDINTRIVPTPPPPANFTVGETITLQCDEAESIHCIVYVITNTLPENRSVVESPPFSIEIAIKRLDKTIHSSSYEVNQWGGATIHIKK